uniref:Uncharacterized protein n=1 Tax=Anguilla anguilla TaxID=7936 RepID=A0A0E9WNS4_ANGAN
MAGKKIFTMWRGLVPFGKVLVTVDPPLVK